LGLHHLDKPPIMPITTQVVSVPVHLVKALHLARPPLVHKTLAVEEVLAPVKINHLETLPVIQVDLELLRPSAPNLHLGLPLHLVALLHLVLHRPLAEELLLDRLPLGRTTKYLVVDLDQLPHSDLEQHLLVSVTLHHQTTSSSSHHLVVSEVVVQHLAALSPVITRLVLVVSAVVVHSSNLRSHQNLHLEAGVDEILMNIM